MCDRHVDGIVVLHEVGLLLCRMYVMMFAFCRRSPCTICWSQFCSSCSMRPIPTSNFVTEFVGLHLEPLCLLQRNHITDCSASLDVGLGRFVSRPYGAEGYAVTHHCIFSAIHSIPHRSGGGACVVPDSPSGTGF